jgi:peroxiredoxin
MKTYKNFLIVSSLVALIVVLGFLIFKLAEENRKIRSFLPFLIPGEKISYFDLIGENGENIDATLLDFQRPSVIFIFSRPCSPCEKNIAYWKKIFSIAKDKADFYGIVIDEPAAAFNFAHKANLKFKIYVPDDYQKFVDHLRLKTNFAQTILYHEHVKLSYWGELDGKRATRIIDEIKTHRGGR